MDARNWHSERLKKFIDLTKLSKEELIAEIFTEREKYLEIEYNLGTEDKSNIDVEDEQ